MTPHRIENKRKVLRGSDPAEKATIEQQVKTLGAAKVNLNAVGIDSPAVREKRNQDSDGFKSKAEIRMIQIDGKKRCPHFSFIAGNGGFRGGTTGAHVSQNVVRVEEVCSVATEGVKGLYQMWNFRDGNNVVAESLLKMGSKIHEVILTHSIIILLWNRAPKKARHEPFATSQRSAISLLHL